MEALTDLLNALLPNDAQGATVTISAIAVLIAALKFFFGDTRAEREQSVTGLTRWLHTRQERAIERESKLDVARREATDAKVDSLREQVEQMRDELADMRREQHLYQRYIAYITRQYTDIVARATLDGAEVEHDLLSLEEWIREQHS